MLRSALSPETSLAVPNSSAQAAASEARARCSPPSSSADRSPGRVPSARTSGAWPRHRARCAVAVHGLAVPFAEPDEVVGPAGLGAGADGGLLPAAERLALHDGAGDAAVHVEVAGLDGLQPESQLVRGPANAGPRSGRSRCGWLDGDGLLQRRRRSSRPGPGRRTRSGGSRIRARTPVADARAPELAGIVELPGLDGPAFALRPAW